MTVRPSGAVRASGGAAGNAAWSAAVRRAAASTGGYRSFKAAWIPSGSSTAALSGDRARFSESSV